MKYRFSIITCTKNSAKFVKDTIDSVKSQTFKDYEHVFIDGFSSDGTKEIIEKYQKENPERVKLFQSEPKGITNALNLGVTKSCGEYIIHMNSDDFFDNKEVLKKVNEFLIAQNNPDWIYGKTKCVDADKNEIKTNNCTSFTQFNHNNIYKKQLLKYQNIICHQSVFIKKSIFNQYGEFDEKNIATADYDYWLRIMNKTKWYFFDDIIADFRVHDKSFTSSFNNRQKLDLEINLCQKRHLNILEYRIILPIITLAIANYYSIKNIIWLFRSGKNIYYLK